MKTCYKCGIELTDLNTGGNVFLSNPPKYICKNCAGEQVDQYNKMTTQAKPLTEEQKKYYEEMIKPID